MTSSTTTEMAIVQGRFTIINLNSKEIICSFHALGTSSIFFFAYLTALENAKKSMINRAVDYLTKNKMTF